MSRSTNWHSWCGWAFLVALLTVALSACGGTSSDAAAGSSDQLYTPDTPVPTDTPVSDYSRYVAWRGGMVHIVTGVRSAYRELQGAVLQIDSGNGVTAEGDMQNAQDAIRRAQDEYQTLDPPSNYRSIHTIMGHALDTYLGAITTLLGGIDSGDYLQIRSGIQNLRQGDQDLREIRALENQRQWLQWLDSNRGKPGQGKTGSA